MARRIPVPIHIDIPYGQEGEISFYINDILYEGVMDFKIGIYLNNVWTVEGKVFGSDKTDTNIATGNMIKVFNNTTHLFTAILDKPKWLTEDEVEIRGICKVASDIKNKRLSNSIENVTYWENKTSAYIVNRICSINNDGVSPWVVTPNHVSTHSKLFVRADNDTGLNAVLNTIKAANYDWYPSYGVTPYNDTILNIEDEKGSVSPVMTIYVSGDDQNAEVTSREENRDELWNDVIICGYGDGINQIKARALSTSVDKTYLSSDITATTTTATVDDGSVLPANGNVVIGSELCQFTRSINTLTITRDDTSIASGSDHLAKSYAHDTGIAVYEYHTTTSPESGSSVDIYGHKANTLTDRSIMDQNTLDFVAQSVLAEHDTELVRIEVSISDMYEILETLVVGDYITIDDAAAGNDANFRVIGMEITDYELRLVCSNSPRSLVSTIADSESSEKNLNHYMQGSTNIYAINEAENCDSSNYLNIRFFIPTEVVAIDKILLNFKLEDFRSYSATTGTGSAHNHPVTMSNAGGHNHTVTDPQHSHTINSATSGSFLNPSSIGGHSAIVVGTTTASKAAWMPIQDFSVGTFWYGNAVLSVYLNNSSNQTFNLEFYRNVSWTTLYSAWTGTKDEDANYLMYNYDCTTRFHTPWTSTDIRGETVLVHLIPAASVTEYFAVFSPNVYASHTHSISATTAQNASTSVTVSSTDGIHNHQATTATSDESSHTHGVTGAITTTALSSPSVDVYTGEDGSTMTLKNTYTTNQTEVDISSEVRDIGTNKWVNVQFRANKLMRIESTLYVQIFIKSE